MLSYKHYKEPKALQFINKTVIHYSKHPDLIKVLYKYRTLLINYPGRPRQPQKIHNQGNTEGSATLRRRHG